MKRVPLWPAAIVGFFVLAILYLASFIIWTLNHRMDLVAEDYYEQEIAYQQQIDAQTRTQALADKPSWALDPDGRALVLRFPQTLRPRMQDVRVRLYRPSDKTLDRTLPVAPAEEVALDVSALPGGLWRISLEWSLEGAPYALGDSFHLPGTTP